MAYQLRGQVTVMWVGDGVGPMEVGSAQVLTVTVGPTQNSSVAAITVPGANSPSTANISTACTSFATAAAAALNAAIGQIQGFSTGGG